MKSNFKTLFVRSRITLLSLAVLLLNVTLATSAHAQFGPPSITYYVSKNGDNSDGRTWQNAFNELDQIPWEQFSARDKIILDGGQRRMIYRKSMNATSAGSYYGRLAISVSLEEGHNGQVVIAPGPNANGIQLSGSGIEVNGTKRSGIIVWGAKRGVIILPSGPFSSSVSNLEIAHCSEAGVYLGGSHYYTGLNKLLIHDNKTNVLAQGGSYVGAAVLEKCWIFNNRYRKNSDGVRLEGSQSSAPVPGVRMTNCVLGPGLRDGINNPTPAVPTLKNCLIINCTRNNVSSPSISLENVTSFMTRRNPLNLSHSCVELIPGSLPYLGPRSVIKKSIFFGGLVEIPATVQYPGGGPTIPLPITVEENTQFRTTGNTTILAAEMSNPKFKTRVGLVSNQTPIHILKQLDFSLRPDSPSLGSGSSITSVKNLLNSFEQ